MLKDYEFQPAALQDVSSLRGQQLLDLKGQVYDPLEERIELAGPACLLIQNGARDVGYALVDGRTQHRVTLLEFYLVPSHRRNALAILGRLVRDFRISGWYVNSKDCFALPLLLESGCPYDLDGFIFAVQPLSDSGGGVDDRLSLAAADTDDLEETYQMIMQDNFYTGNGREGLAVRIGNGEIHLLRLRGELVGVGFVCPLARTPRYADIAMIIDGNHRRRGLASYLVTQLTRIGFDKGLIPTALTSPGNVASRRTLEKCGFYLDGCMLIARMSGSNEQT